MYVWAVFRLIMDLILVLLLQSLQCRGYRYVSRLQACVTITGMCYYARAWVCFLWSGSFSFLDFFWVYLVESLCQPGVLPTRAPLKYSPGK